MNALHKEGLVLLGGPLEGSSDVLLIMRAATPDEILARLEVDPWTGMDLIEWLEFRLGPSAWALWPPNLWRSVTFL